MKKLLSKYTCYIIGSDEIASVIAITLKRAGFYVIMVAGESDLALRRNLAFKDALLAGKKRVDDITAVSLNAEVYHIENNEPEWLEKNIKKSLELLQKKSEFPLLSLMEYSLIKKIKPPIILIDAASNKDYLPDKDSADLVISLNPASVPGINCHLYVETGQGDSLGGIYTAETAMKNHNAAGQTYSEKTVKADWEGVFAANVNIGEKVNKGKRLGKIAGKEIISPYEGIVIGARHSGEIIGHNEPVLLIDEDLHSNKHIRFDLGEKCVGLSVLNALMISFNNNYL